MTEKSSMKIGKPEKVEITNLKGKFLPVVEAMKKVPDGLALPVTFDTEKEAMGAINSIRSAMKAQCFLRRRQKTVYVWNFKKPA